MLSYIGDLHYERSGEGPPLLLIQGASATVRMWGEPLLGALALSFDVVAYDHPGVGGSKSAPACATTAELSDVAVRFLDELGWDRAHVLGVSLGGMVAQHLSLRHPERVRRLVLGACRSGRRTALPDPIVQTGTNVHVPGDRDATARNMFLALVSDAFAAQPRALELFRSVAAPVDPRTAALQADAALRHDLRDHVGRIAAPTLVLHGSEDRIVPRSAGLELATAIPRAKFEEFVAGHLFWLEAPEETARAVDDFLRGAK